MCRRFDTIPACDRRTDRQTDGIAIASTTLAMRALRRAVKTTDCTRSARIVVYTPSVYGSYNNNSYVTNTRSDKCAVWTSTLNDGWA